MKIPRVMVQPSAPPITAVNEFSQGQPIQMPMPTSSAPPPPFPVHSSPTPFPVQSSPPPFSLHPSPLHHQTINLNETNTSDVSGPQIIYVVQQTKKKDKCSTGCSWCLYRVIFIIVLIVAATILASTTASSRRR